MITVLYVRFRQPSQALTAPVGSMPVRFILGSADVGFAVANGILSTICTAVFIIRSSGHLETVSSGDPISAALSTMDTKGDHPKICWIRNRFRRRR